MDKRKVIAAYRRGLITIQECAQIVGVDTRQIYRLVYDPQLAVEPRISEAGMRTSVNR
ncbi:hypothetical protein [Paenibacillus protaetiae]|uniref:hypothetical protein n=1 Tax=Paenibacillus protaetiae TaxID=2509456 RepID=UPI0013ED1F72|nr:hypothetical protein [Paenibacillus protaetiae]